jgi:hypothetical protein
LRGDRSSGVSRTRRAFIADTLDKENIAPGTLTLHAERSTSMRSKGVAALLIDLDVAKTHSRPHVSDDDPYSEAQFKALLSKLSVAFDATDSSRTPIGCWAQGP